MHSDIYTQPRDIQLLSLLLHTRVLTLKHVTALIFNGSKEATKKRVQKLKISGLVLERRRKAYEPGILFLSKHGFECLLEHGALWHAYYVDEDAYDSRGPETQRLVGQELRQVFKDNGSPIDLGFFRRDEFADISAVIFSSNATMGKVIALSSDPNENTWFTALRSNSRSVRPTIIRQNKNQYNEHLLDGLRIYHNPCARHPLDPAIFRHPLVFQSYWNGTEEMVDQRDGLLLIRFLFSLLAKKE